MNKKIKIIDLVNRIESGEKVPEKIKYNQLEFKYDKGSGKYIRKNSSIITWFCIERFTSDFLNKTVEILEDNTEEIEEKGNFEDMGYEIAQAYLEFYKGIAKALTEKRKESEDK